MLVLLVGMLLRWRLWLLLTFTKIHICVLSYARPVACNAPFLLCRFDPATSDINDLKRLLTFSSKFVNSLHLQQLPSHLDLQVIFDAMRRWEKEFAKHCIAKAPNHGFLHPGNSE